jgi:hypothetical protein
MSAFGPLSCEFAELSSRETLFAFHAVMVANAATLLMRSDPARAHEFDARAYCAAVRRNQIHLVLAFCALFVYCDRFSTFAGAAIACTAWEYAALARDAFFGSERWAACAAVLAAYAVYVLAPTSALASGADADSAALACGVLNAASAAAAAAAAASAYAAIDALFDTVGFVTARRETRIYAEYAGAFAALALLSSAFGAGAATGACAAFGAGAAAAAACGLAAASYLDAHHAARYGL